MNTKNNKQKLFEMMEKLNPEINITELFGSQPPPKSPQQPAQPAAQQQPVQPSDVKALSKANTNASTVKTASQRINTATEFPEAFRVWFSSLGYKPNNSTINIPRVKIAVEQVMKSMGFK